MPTNNEVIFMYVIKNVNKVSFARNHQQQTSRLLEKMGIVKRKKGKNDKYTFLIPMQNIERIVDQESWQYTPEHIKEKIHTFYTNYMAINNND